MGLGLLLTEKDSNYLLKLKESHKKLVNNARRVLTRGGNYKVLNREEIKNSKEYIISVENKFFYAQKAKDECFMCHNKFDNCMSWYIKHGNTCFDCDSYFTKLVESKY